MKMKNEYDFTKGMLKKLRTINESTSNKKSIFEQVGPSAPSQEQRNSNDVDMVRDEPEDDAYDKLNDDITVINDVDVKMLSTGEEDMKLTEEQENAISGLIDNFRQQVSQIVEFDPGFTINMDQIRLDGSLTDDDISFVMIAGKESGLYVNADMLKIEEDTIIVLEKLQKFEAVFKTTLEPLITQRDNNI
jgi:hypothetical protein